MPPPLDKTNNCIAERELYREASRLLPRLARDEACIKALDDRENHRDEIYGLFNRRNGFRRPVLYIMAVVVRGLRELGFLDEVGDALVISHEGNMWLRRQSASAEPFTEQHQARRCDRREVNGVSRPVVVNDGESPLGWLHRRKDRDGNPMISAAQYQAGERLRSDFERGQLMPSTTSSWESAAPSRRQRRAAPGGASLLSDTALASRERVAKAISSVGLEFSGILIDVCCHLIGLSETEKANGWPQRSGKVILQFGLSRLARHYGIEEGNSLGAGSRHARIAHWGAEDYRPSLDEWQ